MNCLSVPRHFKPAIPHLSSTKHKKRFKTAQKKSPHNKIQRIYLLIKNKALLLHPQFGEYASGGRVVAGSNPVTPTLKISHLQIVSG